MSGERPHLPLFAPRERGQKRPLWLMSPHRLTVAPVALRFVLLPSPLLGSAVWEPVETALRSADQAVTVVRLEEGVTSPAEVLKGFLSCRLEAPLVLVPHSNAGLFVPALAARRRVVATVFVDAALPPVDAATTTAAPDRFQAFLRDQADSDGLLPVWTEWWGEQVDGLFPDAATRDAVERGQRRLPLTYFQEALPVPGGWHLSACAYLAFGDTYAEQIRAARDWGWPVSVLPGGHLEMLWHPTRVAEEVQRLARLALGEDGR